MRRALVALFALLAAVGAAAPASAVWESTPRGAVNVPDLSNPPSSGDSHHVCVIYDKLDWYRCIYVPRP